MQLHALPDLEVRLVLRLLLHTSTTVFSQHSPVMWS